MKKQNCLVYADGNGEIIYRKLGSHIKKRHLADTPMDKSFVPYIIMIVCTATDFAFFYNLFSLISFDSGPIRAFQCIAMLIGADLVPVYLGIVYRRIKQGVWTDKTVPWLALIVIVLTFATNIVLRIYSFDELIPAVQTYGGPDIQEQLAKEAAKAYKTAVGLTFTGTVVPFITSAASFFISFVTSDPLGSRKRNLEELLAEKKDEIRRLDAIISELELDSNFAENLLRDDETKFEAAKMLQRAKVLLYCDYVRQKLKEHLKNPTAISALSEESSAQILERLYRELAALDTEKAPAYGSTVHNELKTAS